jgi:hypothetical protein
MTLSHISRNYAKAFFTFVTIGLVSACADTTVAPSTADVAAFTAPANFTKVGVVKTFRVNNREGTRERIGSHLISIPAGAICSLTSSYGSTEWDKPCTPLDGSVLITATVLNDNENHPYIDFQPALRFSPTKEVTLFLRNGRSSVATTLVMKYCDNLGMCIDESLDDASLKPFRVGQTSVIGRRVKHFSGYMIAVGDRCNGTITQERDGTWMCNDEGSSRRSGYMVASGDKDKNKDKDRDKDDR